MKRWLTLRHANRAAWTVLGLLGVGIALFAASLLLQRLLAGAPDRGAARTVAMATPPPPATIGPTVRISGTLEQVEGQALVLREADGQTHRVLLRSDAAIARISVGNGAEQLRVGDPVFVNRLVEQQDNTAAVMEVTVIRPSEPVPQERCAQFGTVVAVTPARLTYESRCGLQEVPIRRSLRVTRVEATGVSALKAGQRATVLGQRLPDGTLSAFQIQVTEAQ